MDYAFTPRLKKPMTGSAALINESNIYSTWMGRKSISASPQYFVGLE